MLQASSHQKAAAFRALAARRNMTVMQANAMKKIITTAVLSWLSGATPQSVFVRFLVTVLLSRYQSRFDL